VTQPDAVTKLILDAARGIRRPHTSPTTAGQPKTGVGDSDLYRGSSEQQQGVRDQCPSAPRHSECFG
jgi:hypothetical protein